MTFWRSGWRTSLCNPLFPSHKYLENQNKFATCHSEFQRSNLSITVFTLPKSCLSALLNYTEDIWGSWGTASHILNLRIRQMWVVSFTPQPLYLWGMSPWYPLDRMLSGPQILFELCGENSLRWKKSNPHVPGCSACSLDSTKTELPHLLHSRTPTSKLWHVQNYGGLCGQTQQENIFSFF
jgi:hypothetical protein